jgi:hypothetical protein
MNDLQNGPEGASATQLVGGIITDAQELVKQQLALLRHEVKEDFRKAEEAGSFLVWGLGGALVGSIVLCLMLVHLLSWAAPALPVWVCYGIVGAPIVTLGGALYFAGAHKVRSFNPLHDQSAQALKENYQWITNPK